MKYLFPIKKYFIFFLIHINGFTNIYIKYIKII